MSEPARTPCCIVGCRRTFRADQCGEGHDEVLCGKHFRADPELVRQLRRNRARMRRINRLFMRLARTATPKRLAKMNRIWETLEQRDRMLWGTIKANAQHLQDAGFFAPKPRRRINSGINPVISAGERKRSDRFEDQFQRLKRAGAGGR